MTTTFLKLDWSGERRLYGSVEWCSAIVKWWLPLPSCLLWPAFQVHVSDRLQRALNAAARIVANNRKSGSLLHHTISHDLHWLDVTDRIQFRIAVTMHRCLHGFAPKYLTELCTPASNKSSLATVFDQPAVLCLQSHLLIYPLTVRRRCF